MRFIAALILMGLTAGIAALAAVRAAEPEIAPEIAIEAKRFEYTPSKITLRKGRTVVLALTSADRLHGFEIPELKLRTDVLPGETRRVTITPDRTGVFFFHCDSFCGSGHEDMEGEITVED